MGRDVSVSFSGAMNDPDGEVGLAELTELIARLPSDEALTIADFSSTKVTRWEIRADQCGTPRVKYDSMSWTALRDDDGRLIDRKLSRFLAPADGGRLLLAGGGTEVDPLRAGRALRMAHGRYGHARPLALGMAASVDDLLREATARVPLPQWYELVLLERRPSGRLKLTAMQLFARGERRRATRTFQVRCEPSGPAGTTFAVVARDGPHFSGVVSTASAKIEPGVYTLTATLQRPGVVSFSGLPVGPQRDTRSWAEVRATVPERIRDFGPAHLIVAVETCGSQQQVAAHLDRAGQLISNVAGGTECLVRFSLLAYGAHPHDLRVDDHPVTVLAWAQPDQVVLGHLPVLREHPRVQPDRYTRAANIECMLAEVARRLQEPQRKASEGPAAGRPVLVTVGTRRAFPSAIDPRSEILPCPWGNDWHRFFRWLTEDHKEMMFGAICGTQDTEVWRLLGKDASAELAALDARQFAADLRLLRAAAEHVPFPMAMSEGS